MKKIDLVFRTVGERTSKIALDLAIKNIQPHQVHIIENVKPFSLAVQQMLRIDYECDFVAFMDADCLIMEDMNPFLQENTVPYVDCYVLDKFRGHIHCGIHITRIDVVQAMQKVKVPEDDTQYVLRPESRIRDLALSQLKLEKVFKRFLIFHDFSQFYRDIFAKYALRELRSRTEYHQAKLNFHQEDWEMQDDDMDFQVAKYGIEYARNNLNLNASHLETAKFIKALPEIACGELSKKNIAEKHFFTLDEAWGVSAQLNIRNSHKSKSTKIFGIGLSQTGTKSLTQALTMLGFNVIHSPDDEVTLKELMGKNYNLSILNDFDGITDIPAAPFYPQLDNLFPGSKFILTLRDKESWLKSLEAQWSAKPVFDDLLSSNETNMQRRRLLRVAAYGTYTFNKDRFSHVYDLHSKKIVEYFKSRARSLLIINIYAGEGWEKLCPFLNIPVLDTPFPFLAKKSGFTKILPE
jgi:hypothetical protein